MYNLGGNRTQNEIADGTHPPRSHDDADAIELFCPFNDHWRRTTYENLACERHAGCLCRIYRWLQNIHAVNFLQFLHLFSWNIYLDFTIDHRLWMNGDDMQFDLPVLLCELDRVLKRVSGTFRSVDRYQQLVHMVLIHQN